MNVPPREVLAQDVCACEVAEGPLDFAPMARTLGRGELRDVSASKYLIHWQCSTRAPNARVQLALIVGFIKMPPGLRYQTVRSNRPFFVSADTHGVAGTVGPVLVPVRVQR